MTHTPTTCYAVERRLPDGQVIRLGTVVKNAQGYRFRPFTTAHQSSRRDHATFEGCLPRWVGYPERCETRLLPRRLEA